MRRVLMAVAALVPLAVACHTITEDLPSRPSPADIGAIPVIVISVPVPTPPPIPSPTPRSTPTPQPMPDADPTPTPTPGSGGQNRSPVARVACSVYFVECNGQVMPNSRNATSAAVGCRVHLDATTKDAGNAHTFRTEPQWVFSNPGMIERSGRSAWNPVIAAKGPHHQTMYAQADGLRCDPFGVTFH